MQEVKNFLEVQVSNVAKFFLEVSEDKEILVISHFDTDGITSAGIMVHALQRLDRKFSLKIIKNLDKDFICKLPKDKVVLFLDLASNSFSDIVGAELDNVFIIDHHEIVQEVPENIFIINSELHSGYKISASSLVYLFCLELGKENKDLAKLAILGMIGDCLEKEVDKLNHGILEDGEIQRQRGLMIYPATRPLNRALEFSSQPFIPEVTGNIKGVLELLREVGLSPINGQYKSLVDLSEEEMEKLVTAVMLRNPNFKNNDLIGDIFLIKFFGKLEDARELSAKINACSRSGKSSVAVRFCMENLKVKKEIDSIHMKYKQELISAIKYANDEEKVEVGNLIVLNSGNNIKETMIGTIASILSHSSKMMLGKIIVVLGNYEDKVKVSARVVGKSDYNLREILGSVIDVIGGEVGGHKNAAGCVILQEKEKEFLEMLEKNFLNVEVKE